jgi:adenylate kinase family enzyme
MNERSMIMLHGKPGSGKSTLGKSLEASFTSEDVAAKHVSLGDQVRAIYHGERGSYYTNVIRRHLESGDPHAPLDRSIAYGVVLEALQRPDVDAADLIFLDGYPRSHDQVEGVLELASGGDYDIRGLLQTEVDTEIAYRRLMKRNRPLGRAALNDADIRRRFQTYDQDTPAMLAELGVLGIPAETIKTSGPKEATLRHALVATAYMLGSRDSEYDQSA